MRARTIADAHTRARTDAARGRACVRRARIGDPFVRVASRVDTATCMHWVYIICVCACSIDGWRYKESAPHSHTCRAFAHRQRPHAIARACNNINACPFTYPDFASICIYTWILYMTCALATYTGGRTHARACDCDGRIVGARDRTHVCIRGGAAACTPIPISRTRTRAALPTHGDTRACARLHICAHTRERASAVAAVHNNPRRIEHPQSASRPRWGAARA